MKANKSKGHRLNALAKLTLHVKHYLQYTIRGEGGREREKPRQISAQCLPCGKMPVERLVHVIQSFTMHIVLSYIRPSVWSCERLNGPLDVLPGDSWAASGRLALIMP